MDEVRNGLYYFETTLHDLAPEVAASLERAVAEHYPGARRAARRFLRFGSWIGGDRDGNPFVTVAATEEALRAHHDLALRLLRRGIERLHGHLSTTERLGRRARAPREPARRTPRRSRTRRGGPRSATGASRTARSCATSTGSSGRPSRRAPGPGAPTTSCARAPTPTPRSSSPTSACCRRACAPTAASAWPTGGSATLVRQAEIFGFHLASLDLRQDSARHAERGRRGARPLRRLAGLRARRAEDERAALLTARDPRPGGPSPRTASTSARPRTRRSTSSASCAAPTSGSGRPRSRATS